MFVCFWGKRKVSDSRDDNLRNRTCSLTVLPRHPGRRPQEVSLWSGLPRLIGLAVTLPLHRALLPGQTCVNILRHQKAEDWCQHRYKTWKSEQTALLDPIDPICFFIYVYSKSIIIKSIISPSRSWTSEKQQRMLASAKQSWSSKIRAEEHESVISSLGVLMSWSIQSRLFCP